MAFKDDDAGQLGDGRAGEGEVLELDFDGLPRFGIGPAEFINEQAGELEFLEEFAGGGNVQGHGGERVN
jgi:hypothetical protein